MPAEAERIAKFMAAAGLCSRREAERWIASGRVTVNGQTITSPALNVSRNDVVEVDGSVVGGKSPIRLWLYHKPAGLLTTHNDPEGRSTVFDALPDTMPRVISIGRLDMNSEGLLLLTTSGELARHLELPATGWIRRYRVRVFGKPTPAQLEKLCRGVTVDGVRYKAEHIDKEHETKSHCWLNVSLKEGKNREIRKLFESLGMQVTRLIRTAYGPFQLGKLERGSIKEANGKMLRQQLGSIYMKLEGKA